MKAILVCFLIIGFVVQALAQSTTGTGTLTPTFTGTGTQSGTGSQSVTRTATLTGTGSSSITASVTNTATVTVTTSATSSVTYPPGDAPVNLNNFCKNHIVTICPSWEDPPGFSYPSYYVWYRAQGAANFQLTRDSPVIGKQSTKVDGLTGGTTYEFFVNGIDANGVLSLDSAVATFTTDPTDAKVDPTKDIRNFVCLPVINSQSRTAIQCTWTAAATSPIQIKIKVKCVSTLREPLLIRKRLRNTQATGTSVTINMHRDVATCILHFKAYYTRRAGRRHYVSVIV